MIYNNVELYNVTELVKNQDGSERMCRIPEDLRVTLNDTAQNNALCTSGVEIRFVIKSGNATIRFDSDVSGAEIYFGCFQGDAVKSTDCEISVSLPDTIKLLRKLTEDYNLPFKADVVRLILPYGSKASIVSAEGDIRVPKASETPRKKLLIYGSSITHGSSAMHPAGTYAMRTAMQLGVDLINLGIAGGAMMESSMADYIAVRNDFDYAVVEMGINYQWDSEKMCFRSPESFSEKIDYFLEKIATSHKDKWIFATAFYPCKEDYYYKADSVVEAYREIVKNKVKSLNLPKLVYLEGKEMMPFGIAGLSADLIHPSAEGAKNIADYLAKKISDYISE